MAPEGIASPPSAARNDTGLWQTSRPKIERHPPFRAIAFGCILNRFKLGVLFHHHVHPLIIEAGPLVTEALGRLILERGGRGQKAIQEVLLRLVGVSPPFRRQLALGGLARVALFHGEPQAYAALLEGLDDHQAEVRWRVANLIIDAYLGAKREVPQEVIDKLRQMAESDPDDYARRTAKRFLGEPWAQDQ